MAQDAARSLDAIKSDVCNTTLVVMAWLVIPAIIVSILRAQEIGWTAQYVGQCIGAAVIWAAAAFHRRLPYGFRAFVCLAVLFGMGWTGQIYTTAPTSYVYYASASAMAAVFFGARAGVAAIAASLAITASTFVLIKAGVFPTPTYAAGMAATTWISRGAALVLAAAGPVIAVSRFASSLTRELARAEAASEAKSAFLATMSHELRTPMTAIIGTAELLRDEPLGPDQARKVERIARSGKNLLSLLNDVLDFAKIEAGQMTVDRVAFSLGEVLEEVRELFNPLAGEKRLILSVEVRGCHDALVGDPARLRQIISNLVGNALKFTRDGEVVISASQHEAGPGRVTLRVAVTDQGIGISADDQTRLFQPFVQAQDFRSRSHGGTGLGLTISRKLAELMGGGISVTSEVGKGSTFTLTLPFDLAAAAPATPADSRAAVAAGRAPLRLLLAEDNEAIRELMSEMLTRRGHAVVSVGDGREAVEAARGGAFDAVVMDMHMPVMDGAEATRAIRALGGRAARVPVIALTAGLTEDQRRAYLAAGVDQVVAKPAHWPTLFEAVESRGLSFGAERVVPPAEAGVPLDEALLGDLEAALGAEALKGALATYRAGVEGYMKDLAAAIAAGDAAAARRLGHALKGASLQFGAAELARLGAAIESKSAGLEEIKATAADLAAAFARFTAALERRAAA